MTDTWVVAAPPARSAAFHGAEGPRGAERLRAAVALDGLLWLGQNAVRLGVPGSAAATQHTAIVEWMLQRPDVARLCFADHRYRAWFAALRRATEHEQRSPDWVSAHLAAEPLLLLGWLGDIASGRRWIARTGESGRCSPVGSDVVWTGPDRLVEIEVDGAAGVVLDGECRVTVEVTHGEPPAVHVEPGGSVITPRPLVATSVGAVELLAQSAFPELGRPGATEPTDLSRDEIASCVEIAFATVLAAWPQAQPDLAATCRGLVALAAPDGMWHSATTEEVPLALAITVRAGAHAMQMAESIVHEAAHALLDELLALTPLVENGPECIYRHPWRPELRPMLGVLLGAHAFANVLRFYELALLHGVGDPAVVLHEIEGREREVREAIDLLDRHARFTPAGAALFDELCIGTLDRAA